MTVTIDMPPGALVYMKSHNMDAQSFINHVVFMWRLYTLDEDMDFILEVLKDRDWEIHELEHRAKEYALLAGDEFTRTIGYLTTSGKIDVKCVNGRVMVSLPEGVRP